MYIPLVLIWAIKDASSIDASSPNDDYDDDHDNDDYDDDDYDDHDYDYFCTNFRRDSPTFCKNYYIFSCCKTKLKKGERNH
jgi:hypothetical protein